jgi:mono/diheme cytochrome c family protein
MSTPDPRQEPQSGEAPLPIREQTGRNVFRPAFSPRSLAILVLLVMVVSGGAVVAYLMFSGPHMRIQPKLLPYQARLPALPTTTVPVVPVAEQSLAPGRNSLADTERTRRAGEAYYANYCTCCHGKSGRGDGPVGRSYTPAPTDLTAPAVAALTDEALYQRMLTGVGHAPVLSHAVDPEARWYIVLYVRSLGGTGK